MNLYQEIIFLNTFYKGKFCVENVIGYYEPLITPQKRDRHYYWTNFKLPNQVSSRKNPDISRTKDTVGALTKFHDYDFRKYQGKQDCRKMARNLVDYEAGKTILETYLGIQRAKDIKQTSLF
jgi:DNA (cytosine-5)-methyltransferase 1